MGDAGPTQTLHPTSESFASSPPPTEGVLMSVVPDSLTSSGPLGTRPNAEQQESEGLRAVYLAQGRFDAKNVHYVLISDRAELYTWGSGTFGRLGHGQTKDEARPRAVEALAQQRIRWVACGWDTAAAVTARGELYVWGNGEAIPRFVPFPGEGSLRVTKVCLGEAHAAVLSERGDVYTFGAFVHGRKTKRAAQRRQRGQEGWVRDPHPRVVYNLPAGQTKNIACGSHHILALTAKGKVYSWGDGSWGKLGHGSETEEWLPRPIEAFENRTVVQIDAGDDHSAFLSSDGTEYQEEFVAEEGAKKEDAGILAPMEVGGALDSRQVVAICAGAAFTLCRTIAKEIFYFGKPDFDEALGVAHTPSLLASIEPYPLSAMASRAYRSATINDDKKAASLIQKQKESPQIAKVKGIWDKRGRTLGDNEAEALRQAVANRNNKNQAVRIKLRIERRLSDSELRQMGDEEMVGHAPALADSSDVGRPGDLEQDARKSSGLVADSEPRAVASSPSAPAAEEPRAEAKDDQQPTSADGASAERQPDASNGHASEPRATTTTTAEVERPLEEDELRREEGLTEKNSPAQGEDIRGETPRRREGEGETEDSATDGEDEEDIRMETPRSADGRQTKDEPTSSEAGDGDGSEHALTEGEDEEDIRGEELTPRRDAGTDKAAGAKRKDGGDDDDEEDDEPTEGEDEEDIRGETPRGKEQQGGDLVVKPGEDDDEDEDTLTEGDDEDEIRGEEDDETALREALSASARAVRLQQKEGKAKKREGKGKGKGGRKKQKKEKAREQQKEEGKSARKIVRNISLKLIGKSTTIEREAKAEKDDRKKQKKEKKAKKANTISMSPRVAREEGQQSNGSLVKADGSSDPQAGVVAAQISVKPAPTAGGDESGHWMTATSSNPTKRSSRGFLTRSGRAGEALNNAEAERGGGGGYPAILGSSAGTVGTNQARWKSREKLAIRRSVSSDPQQQQQQQPADEKRTSAGEDGLLRVQIRQSQEAVARRKSREEAEKQASREADGSVVAKAERRASNGFAEKAIERRSKELRMDEIDAGDAEKGGEADEDKSGGQADRSGSPFKKFHTIGRAHRRRNKTINSGVAVASDSTETVPTKKQKRFSISTPFHGFSSTASRPRVNFTSEAARLKEFENRLKGFRPSENSAEQRAAVLKEWASFLLAQQAAKLLDDKEGSGLKKGPLAKDSPAGSPSPSPKKSRFGTLRRRKKEEDQKEEDLKRTASAERSEEEIAGTIIGNDEILLRLESGETIRLAYREAKRCWEEDHSVSSSSFDASASPPPSPSPESSPSGSPRTPGRSRLPRVPLFRTHSLSLNFLRGSSDKKSDNKISRNSDGSGTDNVDKAGPPPRQRGDARAGAPVDHREETFSDVWRREREQLRQKLEAEEEKRKAERKQRKKLKEKEWALKGEAQGKQLDLEEQARHSDSDYSSSDLKLETTPLDHQVHATEPDEQEA